MPRTIEHIVQCHRDAAALRAAGKPVWPYTANVKAVLHEDPTNTTPEHVADVANRIAAVLRASLPKRFFDCTHEDCDFDFVETVEQMEECTVDALAGDLRNGVDAPTMLKGWLERVYDWADRTRVWMGP